MIRNGVARLVLVMMLCALAWPARGHDNYQNFWSGGSPGVGRWCCTGDEKTGDCEPALEHRVNRDGSVAFLIKRYGLKWVTVPKRRILWMDVPGRPEPAHWCGKPRAMLGNPAPDDDDPNPEFVTFCAAVRPDSF